MSRLPSS